MGLVNDPTIKPLDRCGWYYCGKVVYAKLSGEQILAIVLVIKLFLNKCRCFVVSMTQPKVVAWIGQLVLCMS